MSRILFSETQKFTQSWLIAIIIISDLIVLVTFIWAFYRQLILGEPWGDEPLSDTGLIILFLSTLLIMGMVNIMFFGAKLEVQIKDNSVYYKYFPFVWDWKYIHKEAIDQYEIKKFNALSEFGGYGYRKRFFKKTTGLIVKGYYALQLHLHDGSKWVIGTQQPEEMRKAMGKIMDKDIDY